MSLDPASRDGDVEALMVDRYLESLLARAPLDPSDVPEELRATAHWLSVALPRHHPSFRFEDELAARLAAAVTDHAGELIEFPRRPSREWMTEARASQVRPVVIGGVLTSAAISIAGAAWVAWRRGRPDVGPMTRAVRAVSRARVV